MDVNISSEVDIIKDATRVALTTSQNADDKAELALKEAKDAMILAKDDQYEINDLIFPKVEDLKERVYQLEKFKSFTYCAFTLTLINLFGVAVILFLK